MTMQRIVKGLVVASGLVASGCATTAPSPVRRLTTDSYYSAGRAIQEFCAASHQGWRSAHGCHG